MDRVIKKAMFSPYNNTKGSLVRHRESANDYHMSLYRVLLVEDDFDDQLFSQKELMHLENIGKVECFPNGRELQEYLKEHTAKDKDFLHIAPVLIVLDLDMPLMNGFEVLRMLKADPRYEDIPVIVVTGEQNRWNLDKAYSYKADAVFKKPLDITEISNFFAKTG